MKSLLHVVGGIAFVASLGAAAAACSSSDPAAAPSPTPAPTPCPRTIEETNGAACNTEGGFCSPGFACGTVLQQARCTCTKGKFACEDQVAVIAPGAAPQCKVLTPDPVAACPPSVETASGRPCTTPYRQCVYDAPSCSEQTVPAFDMCFCRSDDDGGLTFKCETSSCNPPAPPIDSGADAAPSPPDATGGDGGSHADARG